MAPPARTITVALDMSKAFDTINIHTLIRKLLQTNIPGTIIKFIANYIKGRKAYTTYRNHTSKQRQFKTGVPQGGVLSPTLFNIYTSDLPPPTQHTSTLQGSKKHYFQQRPLHNKHSHRPPHSHYNRHKNKHAPYTYIYCL